MKASANTWAIAAIVALCGCDTTTGMPNAIDGAGVTHVPVRVSRAVDHGPVAADEVLRLVVALRPRDPGLVATLLRAPRSRPLAPEEFADRHGQSRDDYQALAQWLDENGLRVVRTAPGRTTITVEGAVGDVERVFGVRLHRFEDGGGHFRAPTAEPVLSGARLGIVLGVMGLDDARRWRSHAHRMPASPNGGGTKGSYVATDLHSLYRTDGLLQQGAGETVAILGTGGPPDPAKDVGAFVQKSGLATDVNAQYGQVLVGGPARDPPQMGEYDENCLDAEMVFALAPKAKVAHVLTATNTPGLFTDGISYIVNQLPQAHAVSLSYGLCERLSVTEMPIMNLLFAQARAQGQQWFAASGDAGTDGCSDGSGSKVLSPGWPGTSPSVIGVGGTLLSKAGAELAWGACNCGGSGGGHSEDMDKPAWQAGVGPYPNDGARDEPDVAALAGPPGVQVVAGGQLDVFLGTSAAAPMWAGVWALIDEAKGGQGLPTGLERLYTLGASGLGFHDINAGSSSDGTAPGFPALAGFDLATGWGSPDTASLIQKW